MTGRPGGNENIILVALARTPIVAFILCWLWYVPITPRNKRVLFCTSFSTALCNAAMCVGDMDSIYLYKLFGFFFVFPYPPF